MVNFAPAFFCRASRFTAAILLASALGGCFNEPRYDRTDFVTQGAGDANAINKVSQTITPWPKEAKDTKLDVDGKRLGIAVQRYQLNKSVQPRDLNTTTVSEQGGPGNQGTTAIQK